MEPNTNHFSYACTMNDACYVYGSRNELEMFRSVSDNNFANVRRFFRLPDFSELKY